LTSIENGALFRKLAALSRVITRPASVWDGQHPDRVKNIPKAGQDKGPAHDSSSHVRQRTQRPNQKKGTGHSKQHTLEQDIFRAYPSGPPCQNTLTDKIRPDQPPQNKPGHHNGYKDIPKYLSGIIHNIPLS